MQNDLITDWDIQALLDNELDWERQKLALQAIETNPDLRRRYLQYKKQKELLKNWWKDN